MSFSGRNRRRAGRTTARAAAAGFAALLCGPGPAAAPPPGPASAVPRLVVLADTGERRDGLPVLAVHPAGGEVATALEHGLPGRMLRLYRLEQHYLAAVEGTRPEPAYVLLSDHQGGFARQGFFLGADDKRHAGYVDLYPGWPACGRFGAMDQIFPHELSHVMLHQLVGPPAEGNANQVHAIGVRTDRATAFNEGFAEHFQVLAIDDPGADPATRALAGDREAPARVERRLAAYRRELGASLAFATRMRMGFVAWFSNGEDVLRYHAVKSDAFAREPRILDRLLRGPDPYAAYLIESVLPGAPDDPPKPVARMVATEGVVAALFHRWATDERLRGTYRDAVFYDAFGVTAGEVTPFENVYLKLIRVLHARKPTDVLELIAAYEDVFPDEAATVQEVVAEVFLGQRAQAPREIWLANPDFETGTTLFDQFRGLRRIHTFDLNAASMVDLVGVHGVDRDLAGEILFGAPYDTIDDLRRVPGVNGELVEHLHAMAAGMERLRSGDEEDVTGTLSLRTILMPFAWRLVEAVLIAAAAGAVLYGAIRSGGREGPATRRPWLRSAINGFAAALVGIPAGWAVAAAPGLGSVVAVVVLFGLPGAAWCLRKTRGRSEALRVLAAWAAAALPAAMLVTPW